MADYLKAYQTTGRPPIPVPQTPTDPAQRSAQSLPPLFEPHVEIPGVGTTVTPVASTSTAPPVTAPTLSGSGSSITPTVTNIKDIPPVQVFHPSPHKADTGATAYHQNIVYQPEYAHFSPEVRRILPKTVEYSS